MAGLLWQSLAIWLVAAPPLGLEFTKWWVIAGAYCLASRGVPGLLGTRRIRHSRVGLHYRDDFHDAKARRQSFHDPAARIGFLAFLSVLLRIWATIGELIVAGLAYAFDLKGAMGAPDGDGQELKR